MKITRMGCNSFHNPKFVMDRPNGNSSYLLLYVKSPAIFEFGGETITIKPNQLIVFDIGFPYKYSAYKTNYINDWLYFENCERSFLDSIGLPLNTLIPVQDTDFITDTIKKILFEFNSSNSRRKQTMSLLLHTLLLKASEFYDNIKKNYTPSPYSQRLIQLKNDIFAAPALQWTVEVMAKELNISPTYLQRLYKEMFDTTLIEDVIKSRLQYATDLLLNDKLPITEIARLCGYNNDVHFMRQFKKHYNLTPSEYRRNNISSDVHTH